MECGECTLCCSLLPVLEINKKAGTMCLHCGDSGCLIYDERPESCRVFNCAYHQANKADLQLSPNNCGVIFEKIADDIMLGLVEKNRSGYPHVNGQINEFIKEEINVVMVNKGVPTVIHTDGTNPTDVLKRVKEIADGNSCL